MKADPFSQSGGRWMNREVYSMTGMGNGTMEGKRNSIGNIKEGERAREKTEKEKKKIYINKEARQRE